MDVTCKGIGDAYCSYVGKWILRFQTNQEGINVLYLIERMKELLFRYLIEYDANILSD